MVHGILIVSSFFLASLSIRDAWILFQPDSSFNPSEKKEKLGFQYFGLTFRQSGFIYAVFGVLWSTVTIGLLASFHQAYSWSVFCAVLSIWYFPFGTILGILILLILYVLPLLQMV